LTSRVRLAPAAITAVTFALLASFVIVASPGGADPALDPQEQALLNRINDYRAASGRAPLVLDTDLSEAADWMSFDLGTRTDGKFGHTDSLGRGPGARAGAFGFSGAVGENIAAGFATAENVFLAWQGSSGHNANMLGSLYTVIGIGRAAVPGSKYGIYWTTDFGLPYGAPPTPTPTPAGSSTPAASGSPPATPSSTPTPTPSPGPAPLYAFGDIDCDGAVTSTDALDILQWITGLALAGGGCESENDVNCDGVVDAVDALGLLRYVVGFPPGAPTAGCPAIGVPA
jgi:uncharacterized protein YkwD